MVQTISCEIWPSIGAHARTHSLSFTHTHLHTHTRSSFCVSHWRGPTNSSPLCHYRWSDTQITSEPNGSGHSKDGGWWWCVQWSQSIDSLIHSAKFNCFWWSRTEPHTHCSQSYTHSLSLDLHLCVCVCRSSSHEPHALNGMSEEKQFSFCHKLLLISPPKCIGCQMSRDRNRGKKFGLGFGLGFSVFRSRRLLSRGWSFGFWNCDKNEKSLEPFFQPSNRWGKTSTLVR